jgi:RNase P/RNase MRP subunit POP5
MIYRRKSRYILVETSKEVDMRDRQNEASLKNEMLRFLGEKLYIESNLQIVKQMGENTFIIRVSRGMERSAILALSFIKKVSSSELGFYTIRTSGTISSLKKFYNSNY